MTRRHNIIGCEATELHRLIAFSQAHGTITWGARARRARPAFVFIAGAAAGLACAALLIAST